MRLILLALALCLSNFSLLRAQATELTYTFSSPEACAGVTQLTVDVTVLGFEQLEAGSFTIVWDPAIIGFDYTDVTEGPIDFNLSNLSRSDFGFGVAGSFVADGKMTYAWSSGNPNGTGASVNNGTRIFSIKYDILTPGLTSSVTGDGSIAPIITYYAANNGTIGTTVMNAGAVNTSDLTPPTITCPANASTTAAAGQTSAVVDSIAATATDSCTLASLQYQFTGATTGASPATGINDASGSTFNEGITTVTYTATDAAGNVNTCSFEVEVLPNPNPQPAVTFDIQDLSLACTATETIVEVQVDGFTDIRGFQGTFVFDASEFAYNAANPVTNFNIGVPNFSIADFNFSAAGNGQITFTYTNPTAFSLNDDEVLFSVPLDIIGTPATAVTIDDSRTNLLVLAVRNGVLGFATVITDPGEITIIDTDGPVVSGCPSNLSLSTDSTTCTASPTFAVPTAIDSCTGPATAVLETSLGAGDVFPVGTTTVRYRFDDGNGNSSFCEFDVTVSDMQKPTFDSCPGPVAAMVSSGACNGTATWTPPTAMDACDPNVQVTSNFAPGDVFPLGTTTVIYTATDASGNTETCEFDVTITDNVPPTFDLCPANQLFGLSAGICGYSGSIIIPTASDPCGQVTVAPSMPLPSPFPLGTTTVTYVATDLSGNTASCTFDVVVTDSDAPTVDSCPGNLTLTAATNACTAIANWAAPTFSDPCGGITVTSNFDVGDAVPLGQNLIVYTATDTSGNSVTCEFTVTVVEVDGPVLNGCPTTISVSTASGTCGAVVTYVPPTAVDSCDANPTVTLTAGLASGATFPLGSTTVAYVATDDSGNVSDTCFFEVIVADTENPSVDCPADQVLQAQPGSLGATAPGISVVTSDNCGIADTSFAITGATSFSGSGDASDLVFNIGVSTVTYTVTDVNGNVDSCSFTVTVNTSSVPPVISCPNDTSAIAIPSSCSNSFSGLELEITSDTADIESVTYELTGATSLSSPATGINSVSGVDFTNGITTVTYTATNLIGEETSCSFVVEITPGAGEPVQCPADITMDAALDSCGVTVYWTEPEPMDGCGNPIMLTGTHRPGDFFPLGVTTVSYTATDGQGAQTTCTFDIRILDIEEIEVAGCPSTITVTADMLACEGLNVQWVEPTFTSACNTPTVLSSHSPGDTFSLGTTLVAYVGRLASGEVAICSFEVVVEDRSAPSIDVCTEDISVVAPAGSCEASVTWVDPVAVDNCSSVTYSYSIPNGSVLPVGDTTVTAYATDAAGNVDSCSFSVSVIVDVPPTFDFCPADLTIDAALDSCGVTVYWMEPEATDGCGNPVMLTGTHSPGDFFPIGLTTVSYTATDDQGAQSTCTFDIRILDIEGIEVAGCPSTITVTADVLTCEGLNVQWVEPTFTSACNTPTVLSSHSPGDTFSLGTTLVAYVARLANGRVALCSFEVVVEDRSAPSIDVCTEDISVVAPAGSCEASVTWVDPVAVDNCSAVTYTYSIPNGSTLPIGDTTVTAYATDAAGNVDSCSFSVSVTGGTAPVFDCPSSVVFRADGQLISDPDGFITSGFGSGCDGILLDFNLPTATALCGTVTVRQIEGAASGSVFPVGFSSLLFEATAQDGSTSQCQLSIGVEPVPTLEIASPDTSVCNGATVILEATGIRRANYTWSGPNGFASRDSIITLSNITTADAGTYIVRTRTEGGCAQVDSITVVVDEDPMLEILTPAFICTEPGNDLVLQVADTSGLTLVNWQWSGPNGFTSSLASPILVNASASMSGIYTVNVRTQNGCVGTISKQINVGTQPTTPLVTVSDPTPCVDQEIIFTGSAYTGTSISYAWTVSPSTGSMLNPVNFVSVFRASAPGAYDVCYTATVGGCVSQEVCTTINVEAAPSITISGSDNIQCSDGSQDIRLEEVSGSAGSYEWRGPNGNILSNSALLLIENVTSINAGLYSLQVSSPNGCSADTAINVRISEQPDTPVLLTDDAMLCLGETATLTATDLGSGITYNWSANTSDAQAGIPAASNRAVLAVTPTMAGTYTYELQVVRNGCASETVSVQIEVMDTPNATATFSGNVDCVLPGATLRLVESLGEGTVTGWTGPLGFTSDQSSPSLTNLNDDQSGVYTVRVENAAGCTSSASVTINITRGTAQLETFFDGALCRGETVQLFSSEVAGATYEWTGPNGYTSTDQNPVIQSLTPGLSGSYTVTATLPNGCSSTASEAIELSVLSAPEANDDFFEFTLEGAGSTIDVLDNDILATNGLTITITREAIYGTATVTQDGAIVYNSDAEAPREDRIEYEVCYVDCPSLCSRAIVNIELDYDTKRCIATTVITPNGDGQNDAFYISCLEDTDQLPQNSLTIYNEYGDEVYDAAPYRNDWEGTYDGKRLPDGTYYFIFRETPNGGEQRGFITIYR